MDNMVWVLGPPLFHSIKMIVVLMVVIFCHLRVVFIQPQGIQTKIGHILLHIGLGGINLALMVMVEVVLVLKIQTSPPEI